jgi:hypothetical protein
LSSAISVSARSELSAGFDDAAVRTVGENAPALRLDPSSEAEDE